MHLDEATDQREPDAKAPLGAGDGVLALDEQIEHARELLGRDADTGVLDLDDQLSVLDRRGELDPASILGILGSVVEEIGHHLLDPGRVDLEPGVPMAVLDRELVLACLGPAE